MTTDITELAQREKFEAWAEERCALPWGYLKNRRTNTGYFSKHDYTSLWAAWKAAGAELVEALEKAQTKAVEQGRTACELFDEVTALRQRIAELESRTVTAAAADVLAERQRQVKAEGWSSKHDDQYKNTELAFAASCYAFHAAAASWDLEDDGIPYDSHPVPKQWPWDPSWWKPTDARRDLVKAGALILAEIERIDRAAGIKWEAE